VLVVKIPKLQLRGRAVLVYDEVQTTGRKGVQLFRSLNMAAQQKLQYSGRLTAGARKRLTKAITLLVQGTKKRWIVNPVTGRLNLHQLTFVTLTVSDIGEKLDGKEAYRKLLKPFLDWLRRTKGVNTYIWKAELQRNGQIHYHITLPDFIHYREIRDKWNDIQRRAGIIEKYRQRMLEFHKDGFRVRTDLLAVWPEYQQRQAYEKGMRENWSDPNSTDVHKVYKIKDVASYLVKEIAKSCQNSESLGGKVWDCSENLSAAKYFSAEFKEETFHFVEAAVNEGLAERYDGERFTIYRFKDTGEDLTDYLLTPDQLSHYQVWLYKLQETIQFSDP
jgi:hypothetical protein